MNVKPDVVSVGVSVGTCFVAGALGHAGVRAAVVGRHLPVLQARLLDYRLFGDRGTGRTGLFPEKGHVADGWLLSELSVDEAARLAFHQAVLGSTGVMLTVLTPGGPIAAAGFIVDRIPPDGDREIVVDPVAWAAHWGDTVAATAGDVMAEYPHGDPAALARRYGMMLVRGGARVRAAGPAPTRWRHSVRRGDVVVSARKTAYADFFAVEEYDVSWRRFRGDVTPPARRGVFISGDAVTVVPYDPVRDRVLLIEQFRIGPMARGDRQPWLMEPIAGRIDGGESPEQAARREAEEEAGLVLGALLPVASYYPTPGASAEYLYSYAAIADLPDGIAGVFGLDSESEDIRSHLVPFAALMDIVTTGEAANAPLILTALWLQRERERLRRHLATGCLLGS